MTSSDPSFFEEFHDLDLEALRAAPETDPPSPQTPPQPDAAAAASADAATAASPATDAHDASATAAPPPASTDAPAIAAPTVTVIAPPADDAVAPPTIAPVAPIAVACIITPEAQARRDRLQYIALQTGHRAGTFAWLLFLGSLGASLGKTPLLQLLPVSLLCGAAGLLGGLTAWAFRRPSNAATSETTGVLIFNLAVVIPGLAILLLRILRLLPPGF